MSASGAALRPLLGDGAGGLVVVHAHPDDETLWTGALVATAAAAGVPVTVVTCTRGERGEVIALPGTTSEGMERLFGDGPALAAWRERELAAALAALGGADPAAVGHRFLDALPDPGSDLAGTPSDTVGTPSDTRYEDSGMVWVRPGVAGPDPAVAGGFATADLDGAARRLAGLLRETRAAAVVTYEADGGYGHPDHVRAHAVVARAISLLAVSLPAVSLPGGAAPAFWQVLSDQDDAARADLTLPVEPVLDAVLEALRAHATQVRDVVRGDDADRGRGVLGRYALSNEVEQPIRASERYVRAAPVGSAR